MKYISLIASFLLLLSILHLPIGYYTFLRISITVAALYILINEATKQKKGWVLVFSIVSIIFNPIIPIYLGSKSSWILIDISVALVFLIYTFVNKLKTT